MLLPKIPTVGDSIHLVDRERGNSATKVPVDTILAFVDFSDVTDAVVKTAADLAVAHGTPLILLHAATPDADYEGPELRSDISREGVAGEMHRYHQALRQIEADLRASKINATALLVRSTSARGNPVRKLLLEITRIKPGLIVVGSHGHGIVHDVLLGSVSSAIVHKASCPVLVVPVSKRRKREKMRNPS